MISITHTFFIALLLNLRGVTQLLRCGNVFYCLGTVLFPKKGAEQSQEHCYINNEASMCKITF